MEFTYSISRNRFSKFFKLGDHDTRYSGMEKWKPIYYQMRRFTPGRAVTIGEGTNLLYVVKESSGSLRLVRQGKGNLLSYAWLTKKKKRLSPINLTSYPFARKETFFRIFGQEGEEEFLSSIEITGYHAIHPQKFQDSWFVKRFSSILKFICIYFLYIYT